jgi:hypothetical protein
LENIISWEIERQILEAANAPAEAKFEVMSDSNLGLYVSLEMNGSHYGLFCIENNTWRRMV